MNVDAHTLITGHKSDDQIDAMRTGGRILAQIFSDLAAYVTPGMTEMSIDSWVAQQINLHGATATYKTSEVNFPGVICISVNDQIVHGVPTDYVLRDGDVVSFDLVITYKGMKTDSAFSMVVGEGQAGSTKLLLSATQRSLYAGIAAADAAIKRSGLVRTGDIGAAVEKVLTNAKLGVVRDLVGHGVGLDMHMPPDVPNYGRVGTGAVLRPGDTIAIEPMAVLGGRRAEAIKTLEDGWTISTKNGALSAHYEHTVLITETGAEILTTL